MLDPQPWMAQVGVAGALAVLLLTLGRSYVNHVANQLREERDAHQREIERLTASWEARIADCTRRGDAWETAANRWQAAALQDRDAVQEFQGLAHTTVGLLNAIREEQRRR